MTKRGMEKGGVDWVVGLDGYGWSVRLRGSAENAMENISW